MERLPELQGLNLGAGQLELLFRVAERLNGFPRHIALHPCGIVLSSHDLVDAGAARAERERPPDDPGRQGRRRAARLPEARRPGRADALLDAPRPRRDRAHHRREGRPRPDPARRPGHVRADPALRHARVLPDRVARPARAAAEAPAHAVGGPDRRHLAVPSGAGEVRHDHAVPAPARRDGGADVRPPGPAAGAAGDLRRDRLPRAGDPHARGHGRLRRDQRRPHPAPPRPRGDAPGLPRGLPEPRRRARRRARDRRADLGRGAAVRVVRVLQGARGRVRGADLPVRVAEGALPGALHGRPAHPRPRHVPAAADRGGRPAARHPDPAAGRERERARVHGGARTTTHRRGSSASGWAAGRGRDRRRRDPLDPAGRGPTARSPTWGTSCAAPRSRGR